MRHWLVLALFLLGLGTLRVVACGEEAKCMTNADCDDGNPCTTEWCLRTDPDAPITCDVDRMPGCFYRELEDGTECTFDGRPGLCVDAVCEEDLCVGVVCENDENECTRDCNYATGGCDYRPVADATACEDGVCLDGIDCDEHEPYCLNGVCTVLVDQCTADDLALLQTGEEPWNFDLWDDCRIWTEEPFACSADDIDSCYRENWGTRLTSDCSRCFALWTCSVSDPYGDFSFDRCIGDY